MALGTAAAFTSETKPLAGPIPGTRASVYGGLVGQMIDSIDARMGCQVAYVDTAETPQDFLHRISVACGYVGLAAGVGAVISAMLVLL